MMSWVKLITHKIMIMKERRLNHASEREIERKFYPAEDTRKEKETLAGKEQKEQEETLEPYVNTSFKVHLNDVK